MNNAKLTNIFLIAGMVFVLSACASAQPAQPQLTSGSSGQNQVQNSTGANTTGGTGGARNLDNRLAVGTLLLEGTNQAVTSQEAKQLLTLWQQVQSLEKNNSSTNPADLQNVYQQIQADMTPDQIQAIQNLNLNGTEIQNLMSQYGIQVTPGTPTTGGFPTLTPDQRATRQAQRATQAAGGSGNTGVGSTFSGTPGAGGFFGRGMTRLFVEPLINLLQQRAGA